MTMTIERMTTKLHHSLLKVWHAWLAGSFLVAYVTSDEDTYAMHFFAGYAVLAAIVTRIVVGIFAPASSPLKLTLPRIGTGKGRHPAFAGLATALLLGVGLSAVTGAFADGSTAFEDPHEAVSQACLVIIFSHIAFVTYMYGGKTWIKKTIAASNHQPSQEKSQ